MSSASPVPRCQEWRQPGLEASVCRAEQAWKPTQNRTEGAGLLLAEAAKSVSHGLHSKAPQLVAFVLQPKLLSPSDFKVGLTSSSKAKESKAKHAARSWLHFVEGADGQQPLLGYTRCKL